MSECQGCHDSPKECWPCKAKRLAKERDEALQTLEMERAAHQVSAALVQECREWLERLDDEVIGLGDDELQWREFKARLLQVTDA